MRFLLLPPLHPMKSENEAFYALSALCAASEQCEYKLREKLQRWTITGDAADRIIAKLYEERYLDESRFASAYARDKLRYNQWGKVKIAEALRLLHISPEAIHDACALLPEEEYQDILRSLLKGKCRTIKAKSEYERRGKLIRFALGRGFEMPLVMACLTDVPEEDD